jgi:LPXTG-motif cell wall-anchored protein
VLFVCRRIVVLLAVACMGAGAGPVASALAQGAGDQQYSDPFGDRDSGSGNSDNNSSGSGSSGSSGSGGDVEPLTPAPQTSGGGSSSGGSGSSGASGTAGTSASGSATTTTTAPAATLPNTGLDTRVLLLGGAVLVLLGVGLRMRNAPERF